MLVLCPVLPVKMHMRTILESSQADAERQVMVWMLHLHQDMTVIACLPFCISL